MSDRMDTSQAVLMLTFFLLLGIFGVLTGVKAHVKKQCLEAGYPKSAITWDFDGYCMNLEGTVVVRIDKAGEHR